jgi:hypothetical protein
MSTTDADARFFYAHYSGVAERARTRAAMELDAAADRARRQDIDFLADVLRSGIAAAPDRFQWLDPRRAARLLVDEFRP